ncbi:MAG: ATP-binding cassette domain-containing protein [Halothiobacillaceae bacterium]
MSLQVRDLSFHVGSEPLLEQVEFSITPGERVALIGRNGSGKSTLLRIVMGEQRADEGNVQLTGGARMAALGQDPVIEGEQSVRAYVSGGLGALGQTLAQFHEVSDRLRDEPDSAALLAQLHQLQQEIDAADGWLIDQRVESTLSRLNLPAEQSVASLSGGWRRRVALGRALASAPDVLLLDEPTNHLDIEGIEWLQEFLIGFPGAVLFITHDRAFLQALATRILELDRGRLTSWPGDYDNYLRRKAEREHAERIENAQFDKKLAEEEVWIRKGIQARRTRNEGRVRALKAMRAERAARIERQGTARIAVERGEISGKRVVEAEHVGLTLGKKTILRDFSCTIQRGDRVGLVGPNGAGKTSLLRLLLGEIEPDSGTIRRGTGLSIAHFDQHRAGLDPDRSAVEQLDEGNENLVIGGKPRHAISYLKDFLFSPERARSPVRILSGGERNRLMLARLFLKPANLLVMDEPTNDLDLETLEVLEELLVGYDGTLLLISHDRAFLDNTVTSVLAFEGAGRVVEHVGGYSDWLAARARDADNRKADRVPADRPVSSTDSSSSAAARRPRKLGYREQQELAELPERIEALESEQAALTEQTARPDFYVGPVEEVHETLARLTEVGEALDQAMARWLELETVATGSD